MSKFFSFFSFIRKSFSSRDLYVLDIDHNALNHLSNIKSNSDALYIQFKSKALILYEKEERDSTTHGKNRIVGRNYLEPHRPWVGLR